MPTVGATFNSTVTTLFSPGSLPEGIAGVSYSKQLSTAGATYAVDSGLPPGLSLSSGGLISGTPTTVATYLTIITATLGGQDYTQAYTFRIKNAGEGTGGTGGSSGGGTPPVVVAETSIPPLVFAPDGLDIPNDARVLQGGLADMQRIFGGNLNPGLSTPQGQLASTLTAVVSDAYTQIAQVVNGIDPRYSKGVMQDAIGYLYFLERNPAESTVVTVNCIGKVNVPIPVGALIKDDANIYACLRAVTIPAGGQVETEFANLKTGPILAAASGYTPYQTINGWDKVEFVSSVTGNDVETPQEFEYRRQQSVAINAKGTPASIKAAVLAVPGVLDAYVLDNPLGTPVTQGGQVLVPHSIYVAAVGGDSLAVATAIWRKKDGGCNYNGNTTVVVQDTDGYSVPYPQYPVTFQIPGALPVRFAVQIAASDGLPANIVTLVRNAIISAFNGGDGGARARIGSTIYASRYYAPVSAIAPDALSIISILIGAGVANLTSLTVPINAVPTVTATDIDVVIVG